MSKSLSKRVYLVWIRRNDRADSWCIEGAAGTLKTARAMRDHAEKEGAIETCIKPYLADL
jgi:hypothetical protein